MYLVLIRKYEYCTQWMRLANGPFRLPFQARLYYPEGIRDIHVLEPGYLDLFISSCNWYVLPLVDHSRCGVNRDENTESPIGTSWRCGLSPFSMSKVLGATRITVE